MKERFDKAQRLYVEEGLEPGSCIPCTTEHAHYLLNVMRRQEGGTVLLFNGRDGEWRAEIVDKKKKSCNLLIIEQTRPQTPPGDVIYVFAPLKRARLDYMVQKATEMGVGRLLPVMTAYTQVARVNVERMVANAIEAAEQCGILNVPGISRPEDFAAFLSGWDPGRLLVFCDEGAVAEDPLITLEQIKGHPVGVLIGPEGGFSRDERDLLLAHGSVVPISLGPRILRADTAAVAALALVNAVTGS